MELVCLPLISSQMLDQPNPTQSNPTRPVCFGKSDKLDDHDQQIKFYISSSAICIKYVSVSHKVWSLFTSFRCMIGQMQSFFINQNIRWYVHHYVHCYVRWGVHLHVRGG